MIDSAFESKFSLWDHCTIPTGLQFVAKVTSKKYLMLKK